MTTTLGPLSPEWSNAYAILPTSMRMLFVLKGLPLVRHFEEVVDRLAAPGHTILLATKTAWDDALQPERGRVRSPEA